MNRWWCMDCRKAVEIDKHGRCGNCESEAVDLVEPTNGLTSSVPLVSKGSPGSQAHA